MSKQEEIKQALAAATPGMWNKEGDEIWRRGSGYGGDEPHIYICDVVNPTNAHLIAKAPKYIAYLLEEVEKWKALAEAKVVFASNGNDDYQYGLQEDNMRLRKELEEARNALHKIADGEWEESMDDYLNDVYTTRTINPEQIAHETLALLGQEGEGNHEMS